MEKLKDNDTLQVCFINGKESVIANIPMSEVKELIMDKAYEIITEPECDSSSCAVNGFCECEPINEDMEYSCMYIDFD